MIENRTALHDWKNRNWPHFSDAFSADLFFQEQEIFVHLVPGVYI